MLSRWMFLLSACLAGTFARGAETNRPPVHMLVPGFTVQELPVKLSNQNNLRFAPDGTLTSLGYDGKVWRLRDSNGDGLEDTAEPFWDQPTLSVPLGMAWSTHGLYVSSKGKVSLLRDTNADGRADTEEVIASGWPATDVGSGGVDATAVTLDKDGNVFFGLLVADYSNAYRLRKRSDLKPAEVEWLKQNGRWKESVGADAANDEFSLYNLNSKRGTIQKFDPRTKQLTTVATGLRVPVALAFNREGDLFNTDQEGETWMPNGNPLDELNHIIPGRNYGFPPRHEKWLPDLVSEPPVVAFGPQHQSACGLVFNEPRLKTENWRLNTGIPLPAFPAQGLFGPKWWEGDAFVAGESRGKIWRVRLVKTPHGYVGKSYTIARLDLLTLDLAISPKGDLYVCCHSGPPDWGTGPQGEGKIFKISYTDPKAPQPVAVWPASPTEVCIAFDRPLDRSVTNAIRSAEHRSAGTTNLPSEARRFEATIEFGEYVSAGDRFEVLKPPYAVVEQQDATPRGRIDVRQVSFATATQTTLVLRTGPHPLDVPYAITLGAIVAEFEKTAPSTICLEYSFQGVAAQGLFDAPTIWHPHPDWEITKALTRGSVEHKLFGRTTLRLKTLAEPPVGNWGIRPLGSNSPLDAEWTAWITNSSPDTNRRVIIEAHVEHGLVGGGPRLVACDLTGGTMFPAPFAWFRLPWSPVLRASAGTDSRPVPKPQGDWEHGRELFTGTALNCAKCHRIRGEGGLAGPDLSNLIHRDARSVERDIREPSATLHPDYVTYLAELKNGDSLTGFIRSQGDDSIRLFDADGKDTVIPRADLRNLHPTGQSLMPTGLLDNLKPDDVRDLLTFLLWEPPVRTKAEAERVLRASSPSPLGGERAGERGNPTAALKRPSPLPALSPPVGSGEGKPKALRIVLVASKQDHGPGQHDYPRWQEKWRRLLSALGSSRREEAHSSEVPPGGPGKERAVQPTAPAIAPLSPGERAGVRAGSPSGPGPAPSSSASSQSLLTSAATDVQVETAWEWPTAEQFASADVLVFYFWNHDWSPARYAQFDAYQQRGGGVVILHSACIADREPEKLAERIGLSATPGTVSYRHMPFDLHLVAKNHPLTRGLPERLHFLDEPYWPLIGDPTRVAVLAQGIVDGAAKPLVWIYERAGQDGRSGRVFGSILGHYFWTLDDPLYRVLVLRAIAWAGGADLNRLTDAALLEAAVK